MDDPGPFRFGEPAGGEIASLPPPREGPGLWGWCGIAALGILVLYFFVRMAGCALGLGSVEYHLRVPDVKGVEAGARILYKDVELGEVSDVDLDGRDLRITVRLERKRKGLVKEDAKWGFSEPALANGRRDVVLVDPGTGPVADSGHSFDVDRPSWISRTWRDVLLVLLAIGLVVVLFRPLLNLLTPLVEVFTKPFR